MRRVGHMLAGVAVWAMVASAAVCVATKAPAANLNLNVDSTNTPLGTAANPWFFTCTGCGGGGGGSPGGSSGQLQYNNAGAFGGFTLAGDCTFAEPNITCSKTGGVIFAASATTDTTNASNITSGSLAAARLAAGAAASNLGFTPPSIHGSITIGDCVEWYSATALEDAGAACGSGGGGITALTGDVTASGSGSVAATVHSYNGGTAFGSAAAVNTGTSGATVPLLNGSLTFSGADTFTTLPSLPLASADILVGNGSAIAAAVAVSGDATLSNAGALTVSKSGGVAFGTAAFDNTGTSGATLCLLNGSACTFANLPVLPLVSADILVGNGSGNAAAVALSGDCTLANTGAITCLKTNGTAFTSAATTAIGTSGATIALNNGLNTFSGVLTFSGSVKMSAPFSGSSGHLLMSTTAPSAATGMGTTAPTPVNNNTLVFAITLNAGFSSTAWSFTLPAATTGWACFGHDITTPSVGVAQSATTTTSASFTVSGTPAASDVTQFICAGY